MTLDATAARALSQAAMDYEPSSHSEMSTDQDIAMHSMTAQQTATIADHLLDPSLMDLDVRPDATTAFALNNRIPTLQPAAETSRADTATTTADSLGSESQDQVNTKAQTDSVSTATKQEDAEQDRSVADEAPSEQQQQQQQQRPVTTHAGAYDYHTHNGSGNFGVAPGSSPDDRSRTPSLRVQTNSSESNAADESTPSSPLTELEPSSPVMAHTSVEKPSDLDIEQPADREDIKKDRPARDLRRRNSALATPKPPKRNSTRVSASATPAATLSSKKSTGSRSSKSGSIKKLSLDTMDSPIKGQTSPTLLSPEEEASLKLIREMQEQDFGLRRRRAV